ncbi:hypothetical protein [Ornithinimicrobium sufpigmenti]|uniref:hypothetical protein n=1 Tax=Ornithinimicrobium sufpigmenti TaxID=2508882 RepID=UPI001035D021|nr:MULTISPECIES: hypothetical protein [unclassified Ornithinimicrobium]
MSRPVENQLNRSGLGELSETDHLPLDGQDDPNDSPALGEEPDEQAPGHEHENPDTPDHVHPALKVDDSN